MILEKCPGCEGAGRKTALRTLKVKIPAGINTGGKLRLTGEGVGMHIGILPGYAASHGCVRESSEGALLFYNHAKVGTQVDVGDF